MGKVINLFKRHALVDADGPNKNIGVVQCANCEGATWRVFRIFHHDGVYLTCDGCNAIFHTRDWTEFSELVEK